MKKIRWVRMRGLEHPPGRGLYTFSTRSNLDTFFPQTDTLTPPQCKFGNDRDSSSRSRHQSWFSVVLVSD
jgi:hypothetical protein